MPTMLHNFLLFILLLTSILSCSTRPENTGSGINRRSLDAYYIPSDVVKYLLPEIPTWANTSLSGACHRRESIRYFDAKEVGTSYNLSFFDILQAQINFNQEKQNVLMIARQDPNIDAAKLLGLPPKQEEILFYQAMDRVQAKLYSFPTPDFKRINILWIDPFLLWPENGTNPPTLKPGMAAKLMAHNWAQSGPPVMLSLCLTSTDLEKILEQEKLAEHNIRRLGTEAMSPFDRNLKLASGNKFYIDVFFRNDQELHFYSPNKFVPPEIDGPIKLHDF